MSLKPDEIQVGVSEVVDYTRITGGFEEALREVIKRKVTVEAAKQKGFQVSEDLEYQISKGRQHQLETFIKLGIPEDIFQAKSPQSIEKDRVFPQPQIFTVFIAATCNMSCSYCLNSGGTFGLKSQIMTLETAKNVTAFLDDYVQKTSYDLITINLYGGEPFTNPQAIKEILKG